MPTLSRFLYRPLHHAPKYSSKWSPLLLQFLLPICHPTRCHSCCQPQRNFQLLFQSFNSCLPPSLSTHHTPENFGAGMYLGTPRHLSPWYKHPTLNPSFHLFPLSTPLFTPVFSPLHCSLSTPSLLAILPTLPFPPQPQSLSSLEKGGMPTEILKNKCKCLIFVFLCLY